MTDQALPRRLGRRRFVSTFALPLALPAQADQKGEGYTRLMHNGNSPSFIDFSSKRQKQLYKRNSTDPATAMRYAKALRTGGRLQRAAVILTPFVSSMNPMPTPDILAEYASLQSTLGNYSTAEEYARRAVSYAPEASFAPAATPITACPLWTFTKK